MTTHSEEHPPGRGRLRVVSQDAAPGAEPVVEIRDAALGFITRARANQYVDVEPGVYVVSAALPDGGSPTLAVEVGLGEDRDVDLGEMGSAAAEIDVEAASWSPMVWGGLLSRLTSIKRPPLYSRILAQSSGADRTRPGWPSLNVTDATKLRGATRLELEVEPQLEISLAQFAVGRDIPINVVLPLHSHALPAEVDLQVTFDRSGNLDLVAVPTGTPEIELIADYMRTGQVAAAAEVAKGAEFLLERKTENPVAAALGGYALLRVGASERLHTWPTNLANWFQWLPDGAVIAGELAARQGDDQQAGEWFIDALERGYPMFSDGLSLLASRLRYYLHRDRPPTAVLEREKDVRQLIRMVPFVDFTQLALTFKGLDVDDPAGSQKPISKVEAHTWTELGRS